MEIGFVEYRGDKKKAPTMPPLLSSGEHATYAHLYQSISVHAVGISCRRAIRKSLRKRWHVILLLNFY
jgi:hypothetical protein